MAGIGDIRERRRQRILGNSEERMKRLMGINEKFAAEHPKEKELEKENEKKSSNEEIKGSSKEEKKESSEKRFRKISFGNMVNNNKMIETLKKERKISLNLERMISLNEECSDWEMSKRHLDNEFEKELGKKKLENEILKDLKRPPLTSLEKSSLPHSALAEKTKNEKNTNTEEPKYTKEKDEYKVVGESPDWEKDNGSEGLDIESKMLIEDYEAKLQSLEDFARRIEMDGSHSGRISSTRVMNQKEGKKVEEEEKKVTFSLASSNSPIIMLLSGLLCRLFISLLPLHLQKIMVIFLSLEMFLFSYHYLFTKRVSVRSEPHLVEMALMGMLGVSKRTYCFFRWWLEALAGVLGDLCVFLFSFILLHSFLPDPLPCDFDSR